MNKLLYIINSFMKSLYKFNLIYLLFIILILLMPIFLIYEYNKIFFNYNGVYESNIYSTDDFNKIKEICNQIPDSSLVLDPKASGRLMYTFLPNDPIHAIIINDNFINKIRKLTGNNNLVPCSQIPVEYRKYVTGSYMDWHKDTKMLKNQLQYECVITITNNSDSKTLFDKILYTSSINTEPNSLIIVRADGVTHKVTELTKGERTIIKLVFCENNIENNI